jgi:membrane dipeptidase
MRCVSSIVLSVVLAAPVAAQGTDPALEHAKKLLESTILIDGHNDLPWAIRTAKKTPPTDVVAYDLRKTAEGQTDFARLAEGKVSGQFWSIYIPGEIKDSGFARVQLEEFDIARRMIAQYPDKLVLALTADDIVRAKKQKKIASLLGMEGGHAIENSLGALRAYYDLGARYMTLTHNVTLDWADAALDDPKHDGLTEFGKEVVREMNRLGMLVDLSHVAPSVMSDALTVSEAPVMFSHSSARALVDHKRDVPDSILARLPRNGGVVMVTFVPSFVSEKNRQAGESIGVAIAEIRQRISDSTARRQAIRDYIASHPVPRATIADVADHIEHVRKVAGVDHVGIGSDFDGTDDLPEGLTDVSTFPALFAELIRRGWSDADLKKLAGENILRAMRQAEAVAKRLQASRPASTATITQLDGTSPATN